MARHKLDKINVVDVEASCWDSSEGYCPPMEDGSPQVNEIIEIGICVVDTESLERISKESILVKPEHSKVSEFCTELTTLTQEQVNKGIRFKQACEQLRERYSSHKRLWASFGDYDREQFRRQCREYGWAPYPFGVGHLNIKHIFPLAYGLKKEIGMARALEIAGLGFEGTIHRGVDDSYAIGSILIDIIKRMRQC